jgi:very-short-patch-repair endonuclease
MLALGHTRSTISHRLAQGRLHRLHPGVFAVGHVVVPPAGHRLAALLACGEGAVASHLTAGAAWGLRPHSSGGQHVTVLPGNGSRSRGRLRVHRHRLAVEDISVVDSLRVTTLGRTLIDLGDLLPAEHVRRAFIRAEQFRIIDTVEIDGALDRAGNRRGPSILRGILRAYDPRWQSTRSRLELRALDLVRDSALPQPEVNDWIAGRWEADLLWRDQRVIVEIDGDGVHGTPGAGARDAVRDRALRRLGFRVLRAGEAELANPGRLVATLQRALGVRSGG